MHWQLLITQVQNKNYMRFSKAGNFLYLQPQKKIKVSVKQYMEKIREAKKRSDKV